MQYQSVEQWKYRLAEQEIFETGIAVAHGAITDYITLDRDGRLTIEKGYCWDGPSGPTIDRRSNMRGSLAHDAMYQLLRIGAIDASYRPRIDDYLEQCWIEDGMWSWLAHVEVAIVRRWAHAAAARDPESEPVILTAP